MVKSGDYHMTLQEISDEVGLTKQRVNQIITGALIKLRPRCDELGITSEDLFRDDDNEINDFKADNL